MDNSKMTNFLNNHQQKCRCCFQNFTEQNQKVKITKKICRNFLLVVQIELQMDSSYSNFICELCHNDLEGFVQFKTEAFEKQTQLYNLLETKRKTRGKQLNCKESDDDEPIPDETVLIKMEPDEDFFVKEEFQLTECSVVIESCPQIELLTKIKAEIFENDDNFQIEAPPHFFDSSESSEEDLIAKEWKKLPKIVKRRKKGGKFKMQLPRETNDAQLRKPQRKQCPECGMLVWNLSAHIKTTHLRIFRFFCDICGKGFYEKRRIPRHMFRHLSKETKMEKAGVTCEICGRKLLGKKSLDRHMLNKHNNDEPTFICHCSKAYKNMSMLKAHQKRAHSEKKKFHCKVCSGVYTTKQTLMDHMDIHRRNGREKSACEICGKLYPSPKALAIHKIRHTEPTHVCDICGKKFHLNCFLKRHKRTEHNPDNFGDCEHCGKTLTLTQMHRHVKEFHSGLVKQQCPVDGCGSFFLRKFQMQDHFKRIHKAFFNNLSAAQRTTFDENFEKLSKLLI